MDQNNRIFESVKKPMTIHHINFLQFPANRKDKHKALQCLGGGTN